MEKKNKKQFSYDYEMVSVTVDAIIFGADFSSEAPTLKVLLIERGGSPFKGELAIPGGFVNQRESLDQAVRRELKEETGIENVFVEQLYTFGAPDRDPRSRIFSVAYYALLDLSKYKIKAGSDAKAARWVSIDEALTSRLAFDHNQILQVALNRLRGKIRYEPVGFELLPAEFTIVQLQGLYEAVLGRAIYYSNFRKKMLDMNLLERADVEDEKKAPGRPAQYYRFNKSKYERLKTKGFNFEL